MQVFFNPQNKKWGISFGEESKKYNKYFANKEAAKDFVKTNGASVFYDAWAESWYVTYFSNGKKKKNYYKDEARARAFAASGGRIPDAFKCEHCGGDSSLQRACCETVRQQRAKEALQKVKARTRDFMAIHNGVKINKVFCKDCKKPTKGTYRCEKCKAKHMKRYADCVC